MAKKLSPDKIRASALALKLGKAAQNIKQTQPLPSKRISFAAETITIETPPATQVPTQTIDNNILPDNYSYSNNSENSIDYSNNNENASIIELLPPLMVSASAITIKDKQNSFSDLKLDKDSLPNPTIKIDQVPDTMEDLIVIPEPSPIDNSQRNQPISKKHNNNNDNVFSLKKANSEKSKTTKHKTPTLVSKTDIGLVVTQLGKSYAGKPVVREVCMSLKRGQAVGLLGPNGAGKTTCFYMIMGLIKPDYGDIYLDGKNITKLPVYRRARMGIGYLPQEASVFRGLTVEQNILSILEVCEPIAEKRVIALDSLLAEFSITHLRRTPSIALSGGERRRVEIARALASNPSFILLDEPLAGVDPVAVVEIKNLVAHLKDRNIGVLITDHNVRETLDIVDKAYILHDGQVLMEGTPKEIVSNKEVRRVYLGEGFKL